MFQYSINLAWSDEDEGYIATIPEFPNLSAFGENPEEAVKQAKLVATQMLEVLQEDREAPPAPKKVIEYSGQTRLRLPKSLHRALALEAERECVSLNTLIVSKLSESLRESVQKPFSQEWSVLPAAVRQMGALHTHGGHFAGVIEEPRTVHATYLSSAHLSDLLTWPQLLTAEREEAESATVKCSSSPVPLQRPRR